LSDIYIVMSFNYVDMPDRYVNVSDNDVYMSNNCVDMLDKYVGTVR